MTAIEIGILVVLLLLSLYSCLDHILVPLINRRISELDKRVRDLENEWSCPFEELGRRDRERKE